MKLGRFETESLERPVCLGVRKELLYEIGLREASVVEVKGKNS